MIHRSYAFLALLAVCALAQAAAPRISFQHVRIDPAFRSEGVAVADLNRDGKPDIIAGPHCYTGPTWKLQPLLGEPRTFDPKGYSDAFLCFPDDIDRDGWTDLVVVGFPGAETAWLRNPGAASGAWQRYVAVPQTGNESPEWADVDGDRRKELVFTAPDGVALARPGADPTQPWPVRVIAAPDDPRPGHGLGVGDVNRDKRLDILCPDGWWEAPADRTRTPWPFHRAKLSESCAQLCVYDVDGDGDNDVLSSSAHGYGIWWSEQRPDGWELHEIDRSISQTHALHLADLNGDGLLDFVTGKRFWAHTQGDPGIDEPAVLCWFELRRQNGRPVWTKHVIDEDSGVGLHFQIADVNGDRLPDIVTSNKKGVHVFIQKRTR